MGTYTGDLTRGANGCELENWTEGAVISGVTFDITQDGPSITMAVGGSELAELNLVLGNHNAIGQVSDTAVTANIVGVQQVVNGTCSLRLDGAIVASVSGTKLDGEFHFRQTVLNPGCEFLSDAGVVTTGNPGCDSVTTMHIER
jgi:hypothetical protein